MSSYFKYFAIISFLLIAILAFFSGSYLHHFIAKSIVYAPLIAEAEKSTQFYQKRIWCKFSPLLQKLETLPEKERFEHILFKKFQKNTSLLLQSIPAVDITYIDNKEQELFNIYNTEIVNLSEVGTLSPASSALKSQKPTYSVIPNAGFSNTAGKIEKGKTLIHVAIPLHIRNCPKGSPPTTESANTNYNAIIKITYDVTNQNNELLTIQLWFSGGIVCLFVLLYIALYISSRRAEKIIHKQHEENLSLTQAKSAAEAQNKEKSMFLANVSHELRTPLNAIIGFSEIIKDEAMGPIENEQYKEYINDINASGVHLLSLINDILDYSKAEARKLDVESVDVDLTKLCVTSMRLVEPRAKDAKVNLIAEFSEENHIVLTADPKRLKQVILNILSNSVKFTPEEGKVTLKIQEVSLENQVIITIIDTGIGIAAKDISKALAPFGQVDSALSRRYEGTGLGLPLTKRLTEIMGGNFDIQSELGLGTTITLTFPLTQKKKETEEEKNQF